MNSYDLRDYIEAGIKKYRTAVALSRVLKQNPKALSNAKHHKQGLPNYVCAALADLIGVERINVIAASELVTEKNLDRRNFWLSQPCQHDRRTDASARCSGIERRQGARASDFSGTERRHLLNGDQWVDRRKGDRRGNVSATTSIAQQASERAY